MFSGPHAHTSTCWGRLRQVWAPAGDETTGKLASRAQTPPVRVLAQISPWGFLPATQPLSAFSALPWPRSLSDYRGSAVWLWVRPRKQQQTDKEGRRK